LENQNTVSTIQTSLGFIITLIGTAHLSEISNRQVEEIMQEIQPEVIMVELDPTRLSRIGISSIDTIQVENVIAIGDEIVVPDDDTEKFQSLWKPFWFLQGIVTEGISRMARALLTNMYQAMGSKFSTDNTTTTTTIKDDDGNGSSRRNGGSNSGGGEFLVAIRQAERLDSVHTLILGDRSSLTTIKRATTLAFQSGDPLGVLKRLQDVNAIEMKELEMKVRQELQQEQEQQQQDEEELTSTSERSTTIPLIDERRINIAMMERLKEDSEFRNRLFMKLEQQVPEFTQAFLKERDYIMAEGIRRVVLESTTTTASSDSLSSSSHRQLLSPGRRKKGSSGSIQNVVAVVGLAHIPGMETYLRSMLG